MAHVVSEWVVPMFAWKGLQEEVLFASGVVNKKLGPMVDWLVQPSTTLQLTHFQGIILDTLFAIILSSMTGLRYSLCCRFCLQNYCGSTDIEDMTALLRHQSEELQVLHSGILNVVAIGGSAYLHGYRNRL